MKRTILTIVLAVLAFGSLSAQAAQSGSIVGWGDQVVGVDLSAGFTTIAAGGHHSLGLKEDGSVTAWGYNYHGQCNVPAPNSGFVAIAAGDWHSLGLKVLCQYVLAGDLNDDCKVDFLDVQTFVNTCWLTAGPEGDLYVDDWVDFRDFAVVAMNWLIDCDQTPEDPACVPK